MKKTVWILALLAAVILGGITGCEEAQPGYQFNSQELEKYAIVYQHSEGEYFDLANQLANQILDQYNVMIAVLPDVASSPAQYEILLGDTDRYDYLGNVMEYSVTVDDGKFRINTGGVFSAEKAMAFLCEEVFNGQEIKLENGEYYKRNLLGQVCGLTEGTSARIMSANILADAFADSAYRDANVRAELFAGMLAMYTPDVVGLQEADESWSRVLDVYLAKLQQHYGITYSRHLASYEDKVNYTALLYRSDKYQVDDGGVAPFAWWSDAAFYHSYHMRNITWAQFSPLEQPDKQFIVANTHWSYRTEHADRKTYLTGETLPVAENQLREQCREETDGFLTGLMQEYPNVPVFLTGDFNTSLSYFTRSDWTPSSFKLISEEAKSNATAINEVPDSGHFDHLFGAGSYRINRYAWLKTGEQLTLLTDHPLVYADLAF